MQPVWAEWGDLLSKQDKQTGGAAWRLSAPIEHHSSSPSTHAGQLTTYVIRALSYPWEHKQHTHTPKYDIFWDRVHTAQAGLNFAE